MAERLRRSQTLLESSAHTGTERIARYHITVRALSRPLGCRRVAPHLRGDQSSGPCFTWNASLPCPRK